MRRLDGSTLLSLSKLYLVLRALNICPLAQNQLHEPWFSGYNLKYLIYGQFPKISIPYQGSPHTTYEYLIFGSFPKATLITKGTPGASYKYLIYDRQTNRQDSTRLIGFASGKKHAHLHPVIFCPSFPPGHLLMQRTALSC